MIKKTDKKESLSPRIKSNRVLPQNNAPSTISNGTKVLEMKDRKNLFGGALPKKTAKLLETAATATDEKVIFGDSNTSGNTIDGSTTERVAFRQAITGLYSLASKLHTSDNHKFLANNLQTIEELRGYQGNGGAFSDSTSQHGELLSSEQVWGQLSLFGNPIINSIGRNLSRISDSLTGDPEVGPKKSKDLTKSGKKKITIVGTEKATKRARVEESEDDDDLEEDEEYSEDDDYEEDEESDEESDEDIDPVVAKVLKKEEDTKRRNEERRLAIRSEKDLLIPDMGGEDDDSGEDWGEMFEEEGKSQVNRNKKGRKHKDVLADMNSDDDDADIDKDNEAALNSLLRKQKKMKNKKGPLNEDSEDDLDADDDEEDGELEEGEEEEFDEDAMAALYGDEYEDDDGDGDESDRDDDKLMGEMDEDLDAAVEDMEEALYDDDAELEGYEKGLFHEDGDILQDGYGEDDENSYRDNTVGFGDDGDDEGNGLGLDQYGMGSSSTMRRGNGDEEEGDFVDEDGNILTAYERKSRRQKKEIEDLEMKRIYNADWSMKGEVDARSRPKDSLLTDVQDLDFEHGMKAVPIITEAHTAKLEERIKMRIRDSNFDDVEKRTAVTSAADLAADNYKKISQAGLDATKSSASLVDIYEKDYIERMKRAEAAAVGADEPESAEPLTEIEKDEIKAIQMWKRLSQHLDALSNYFFTPKPVREDLDVRVRAVENHAPAISLENVGLSAVPKGTSSSLAPQDTYRPSKKSMIGNVSLEEMDTKERRALRQAKKATSASTRDRIEKKKAEKEAAKKKKVSA